MSWTDPRSRLRDELARCTARTWRVPLGRGVVTLVVGLALLLAPLTSLAAVVTVLGVGVLADGVVSLVQGVLARGQWGASWRLARGVIGVLAGLFLVWQPSITAKSLMVLVGVAALVTGVVMVAVSVQTRSLGRGAWSGGAVAGVLLALLGVLLMLFPTAALLLVTVVLGIGSLVAGAALVSHGWRLRRAWRDLDRV